MHPPAPSARGGVVGGLPVFPVRTRLPSGLGGGIVLLLVLLWLVHDQVHLSPRNREASLAPQTPIELRLVRLGCKLRSGHPEHLVDLGVHEYAGRVVGECALEGLVVPPGGLGRLPLHKGEHLVEVVGSDALLHLQADARRVREHPAELREEVKRDPLPPPRLSH